MGDDDDHHDPRPDATGTSTVEPDQEP